MVRLNSQVVLTIAGALFTASACGIGDGMADFGQDVAEPEHNSVDAPGERILPGSYADIVSYPDGKLIVVRESMKPDAQITLLLPTGTHCDGGRADRVKFYDSAFTVSIGIGLLSHVSEEGLGTLRLLDGECAPLAETVDDASFPLSSLDNPLELWLRMGDGIGLLPIEAGPAHVVASEAEWFRVHSSRSGLELAEILDRGQFRVVDRTGKTLVSLGSDDEPARLVYEHSADSPLLLFDKKLFQVDPVGPSIRPLIEDREICWVSPDSTRWNAVLQFCDDPDHEYAYGTSVTSDSPYLEVPQGSRRLGSYVPDGTRALYVGNGESSEPVDVYRFAPEQLPRLALQNVVPDTDVWTVSPRGLVLEAVVLRDDDTEALVRRYLDLDLDLDQVLAERLYRWPFDSVAQPLIDEFDGQVGRWVALSGWNPLQRRIIAEGVVPDGGFAPAVLDEAPYQYSGLTVDGWFAFLREYDGRTGELVLAHSPSSSSNGMDVGWQRSLSPRSIPHGFRWLFEDRALVYLADVDPEKRSGTLRIWFRELDLDQVVAADVSDFTGITYPEGVSYLVPEGKRKGIWHARLK